MTETKTPNEKSNPQNTKELLNRLSRIKGQVNGLKGMVEDDAYCIDLIHQIRSVNRALEGLAGEIMEKHLKTCVHDAINSEDPYDEQDKIEEFMDAVGDFLQK
jgi:DNA-binding FrmR family transcriptional regulator